MNESGEPLTEASANTGEAQSGAMEGGRRHRKTRRRRKTKTRRRRQRGRRRSYRRKRRL
jgi:hypothetical protein